MKTGKLIFALVFLMLFADASMAAKWKAKHVVLIGLDGWGAYSVNKAEMPNVKKLMEEGSYTLKKRSVLPSSSAVNWASMYMGAVTGTSWLHGMGIANSGTAFPCSE